MAGVFKSGLTQRRQRQRQQDAIFGYVDANGLRQPGIADQARDHISDDSIHLHPRNRATAGQQDGAS